MGFCRGWVAPADAGWGVEDLEDAGEDDEDGGWGVSAVETLPSLPAASQRQRRSRSRKYASPLILGDEAAASQRQSAVAQGQALTLFQRRLQGVTLTPATGSNTNAGYRE